MPRRLLAVVLVLLAVGVTAPVWATGFLGDSPPTRIPIPARDFAATVEDQDGTRIEVTQVTFNGEVFVYGLYGAGQATVPFERIREVRFEPAERPRQRVAFVTLRDGEHVRLLVDADIPAYGRTSFGTYRIEVEKLRRVQFREPPAESP